MVDAPPTLAESSVNGSTHLQFFTNAISDAQISFAAPIFAFGADFFNFNDGSVRTQVSVLGQTFEPPVLAPGTASFFGLVSDMAFSDVMFLGVANDVFGVDNVSYNITATPNPVSAPASMALLALGLLGFGLQRRT